jgi:anti-anti-sigma factor
LHRSLRYKRVMPHKPPAPNKNTVLFVIEIHGTRLANRRSGASVGPIRAATPSKVPSMFERIESDRGVIRLQLKGVLDAAAWDGLREGLERIAAAPSGDVVLDLSNVSFIDGPAVGAIAFLFKRLSSKSRTLSVIGVTGQPLALLRDHGLTRILRLPPEAAAPPPSMAALSPSTAAKPARRR